MSKNSFMLLFILILFVSSGCARRDTSSFYVSLMGNDTWSGRLMTPNSDKTDGPFATFEKARDAVREIKAEKGLPKSGITIWLMGGVYERDKTFELDERDSGTEKAPVVYRPYNDEEVRLVGGKELKSSTFSPVTDQVILKRIAVGAQGKVYQVDLKEQGITDYGELKMRGFPQPVLPAALELFFNDQSMQLARWPNEGYSQYGKATEQGSVPRYNDNKGDKPGKFLYIDDRPTRWAGLDDVWLYGKWRWQWADETIKVASIDTKKKEITLSAPHNFGVGSDNTFYALNILEEIDMPGEYYLDHKTGILYFWPPSPIEQGKAVVSILEDPMITMEKTSFITIRGMILEASRGLGVYIAEGSNNLVAGCTLRNLGTAAVCIGEGAEGRTIGDMGWSAFSRMYTDTAWNRNGGTNNGVSGCDIYNTGAHGIILGGGDRKTLTPAGNYARNNDIHDFGRWYNVYQPGVSIDGVGNIIANNKIYNAQHSAIMYWGNDHIIEFNEIHHVVNSSGDAGAIYGGRDPSVRGIVIRNNFFHHIGEGGKQLDLHLGVWSVMIDDGQCGERIEGNVFYRGGMGGTKRSPQTIQITGGYDNYIENNIFIDCSEISHAEAKTNEEWIKFVNTPIQLTRLTQAVDVTKPPYTTHYPELADIFKETPSKPRQNYLINNYETTINDPDFEDSANLNFKLKKEAKVFKEIPDFKDIPFEKIGLYIDEYRRKI